MTTALTIGSACSGAGALDLAVERVFDASPRWFCEWEDAPSKVLAYHWPGIPNYRDLTAVDWSTVPAVDIFTAGYPCQPFSAAGKRKGTDDERHLWPFILVALNTLRPRWAVFENVAGHLTLGFDIVLADLASHSWYVRWFACKASDIGAPHHRKRVFILVSREPQPVPDGAREVARLENGVWTEPDAGLFGTIPFADRWPSAGCIVDGVAYDVDTERAAPADVDVLPTPTVGNATGTNERRGGARGDEMLLPGVAVAASRGELADGSLLPTPNAHNSNDGEGFETWDARRRAQQEKHQNGNGRGMPLAIAVQTLTVLPTPRAAEAHQSMAAPAARQHVADGNGGLTEVLGVHLLPTPQASDGVGGKTSAHVGGTRPSGAKRSIDLPTIAARELALLPTPTARLGDGRGASSPERRKELNGKRSGELDEVACYLPTPNASDGSGGGQHPSKREGHSRQLIDYALVDAVEWGKYAPAVDRWEHVLERPAPSPTEPNSKGRPRLAAAFAQWMMGWPEGWVTEPAIWTDDREVIEKIRAGFMPATARSAQLKIIGNGVVDRQAEHALRTMLSWRDESLAGAA